MNSTSGSLIRDAGKLHVRFDERRLETESWRGVRHRHRRKPPATATPCAYRHRASRRLYSTGRGPETRARPREPARPAGGRWACGLGVPLGDPRRRVAGVLHLAESLLNRARHAVPHSPAPTGWAARAAISSFNRFQGSPFSRQIAPLLPHRVSSPVRPSDCRDPRSLSRRFSSRSQASAPPCWGCGSRSARRTFVGPQRSAPRAEGRRDSCCRPFVTRAIRFRT